MYVSPSERYFYFYKKILTAHKFQEIEPNKDHT